MKAPRGPALLLVALCALAAPCAAQVADRAKEEAAAERRLATLREQITGITAEQRAAEGERAKAGDALRAADRAVSDAVRALRRTEAAIANGETELQDLQAKQRTLEFLRRS